MTDYECAGCDCIDHIEWGTHAPVGKCCGTPLVDAAGKPLTEGAVLGRCKKCPRTWRTPDPELLNRGLDDEHGWDWEWRDDIDWRDRLPLPETRELAVHTPIGDGPPEDDR